MELLPVSNDAYFGPNRVWDLAQIYASVGELDAAMDQIDYALSIPGEGSVAMLLAPPWDPLRDHPRFQEILEKYGEEK